MSSIIQPSGNVSGNINTRTGEPVLSHMEFLPNMGVDDPTEALEKMLEISVSYKQRESSNFNTTIEEDYLARQSKFFQNSEEELNSRRGNASGNSAYVSLTQNVCRSLMSWLLSRLFENGKFSWDVMPTSEPVLPSHLQAQIAVEAVQDGLEVFRATGVIPSQEAMEAMVGKTNIEIKENIMEEARMKCKAARRLMEDQMQQGNFVSAIQDFIDHFCTTKTAFFCGPYIKRAKEPVWKDDKWSVIDGETIYWEAPHPLDVFPYPSSTKIDEIGVFRRRRFTESSLHSMMRLSGSNDELLTAAIAEGDAYNNKFGKIMLNGSGSAIRSDEKEFLSSSIQNKGYIEGVEYCGLIPTFFSRKEEYNKNPHRFTIANDKIVRIEKLDGTVGIGWYSASFSNRANSIWGESPPEIIAEQQKVLNVIESALVDNLLASSGPQIVINAIERMQNQEEVTFRPFKVWEFTSQQASPIGGQSSGQKAVEFFQPNMNLQPLLSAYQHFYSQALELIGIAVYPFSGLKGAAQRTVGGLDRALSQSNQQQSTPLRHIDDAIALALRAWYQLNLKKFPKREDIKGDLTCVATASKAMLVKENAVQRLLEFYNMTSNPLDQNLLGPQIRKKMLKAFLETVGLDYIANEIPDDADAEEAQRAIIEQQARGGEGEPTGIGTASQPPGPDNLNMLGGQLGGKTTARVK